MYLLNFGHPLTQEQITVLDKTLDQKVIILNIRVQVNYDELIYPQLEKVIDSISDKLNFQTDPYIVNLPPLSNAAAIILTILHGRSGYFPHILVQKPKENSQPLKYVVGEIVNLQEIRDKERHKRQ